KNFIEISGDSPTDDDISTKYSALLPFILDDCSATYGDNLNTDTVHVCYSVGSDPSTIHCPSADDSFVQSVSAKAWDASLSVTEEYDQEEYYSAQVDTYISQMQEATGLDFEEITENISFEGDWLTQLLDSIGSKSAIQAFTDSTSEECYTDPFAHYEDCVCTIDPYLDPDQCSVSFSDFDDLEDVVIKEVSENPCDVDAFSLDCLCYSNPKSDECQTVETFFSCFYDSYDLSSCCEATDYSSSVCCTVNPDAASTSSCVTYLAADANKESIGFSECMSLPSEGGIASSSSDLDALAVCCFLFGMSMDSQCPSAFSNDEYASISILMDMNSVEYSSGTIDIYEILDRYCGAGTRCEESSVCTALSASTMIFAATYEICLDVLRDPLGCCYLRDADKHWPSLNCGVYKIVDRTECDKVMSELSIEDTICEIGDSTDINAFESSTLACFSMYDIEYCCSNDVIMHNIPFYQLSTYCQAFQYYSYQTGVYAAGENYTKQAVCSYFSDRDSAIDLDLEVDFGEMTDTSCSGFETSFLDCVTWTSNDVDENCRSMYGTHMNLDSIFDEDVDVDSSYVPLPEAYSQTLLSKNSKVDVSLNSLFMNVGSTQRSERRRNRNAVPKVFASELDESIDTTNVGISVDSYDYPVTIYLYSYFMEPTVALSEDGIFVTVATSSDDDTFNSSAISPIFYQYDSSLSSAAHSVEQNISIAAIKEDTHGWAFIKLYGNEMNAYRLSLYLDTCNIDSALQVSGDNAFRAMCITCNGPSTYKGVYETGALCHPCPDGANCHNGGS
ncbi:hypothetical protein ADUPG1_010578, partial [Aduncisulcus paluster]